jgi:hypothetical protein
MSNENQHWVPKFLLKNFVDADGRVFCLNVQTDEITKPPPRLAASTAGFNDFLFDGEAVSFEDQLERIETAAAPILRQIVSSRSVAGLTETQRNQVADFTAAQSFRTEAFYKGLELQSSRQHFGAIFAELWRSARLLSADIVSRKWVVMAINHDDVFYLGDHPVVLQHTEKPSPNEELGFGVKGVEAFLPLSPKCALYMPCVSTSQEIISGYETALLTPENIRLAEFNETSISIDTAKLLELSQRVLRKARALYQALTTGAAFVAAPENINNLNSLQCAFAHTAIYSNQRDFSFARRVFRESPQYRDTVKVRLATVAGTYS